MEPEPEVYTDSGDRKSFTKLKTKYGRNPPIKGEECDFQKYRKDNDEAVHTILDMMDAEHQSLKELKEDVELIKDRLCIRGERGQMKKKKKSKKSKKRSKKGGMPPDMQRERMKKYGKIDIRSKKAILKAVTRRKKSTKRKKSRKRH
tara:strand:+ start:118 stop:558 length:441 start_codon:yes stop_codon:yes gene_type:complete